MSIAKKEMNTVVGAGNRSGRIRLISATNFFDGIRGNAEIHILGIRVYHA